MSISQSPRHVNDKNKPPCCRLTVLGASAVGKTSLLKRFLNDEFNEKYKETIEDLYVRTFRVNGRYIQAHIFDTAGDIQFPAMRRLSIGSAQAYLLVYDIKSEKSFLNLEHIAHEIKDLKSSELRELPIVIAGNKCDAPIDKHRVTSQMVDAFMLNEILDCRAIHLETSAKSGHNVRSIFESFVRLSPMFLDQSIIRSPAIVPVALMATAYDFMRPGQLVVNGGSPFHQKRQKQRRLSLQPFKIGGALSTSCYNMQNKIANDQAREESPSPNFRGHTSSFGETTQLSTGKNQNNDELTELKKCNVRSRRAKFFRRNKTKSHDEYEIPECMVQ